MKLLIATFTLLSSLTVMATTMKASQMDDLIRGEMAAVKSYNQILTDIKNTDERKKLEKIRNDHQDAVTKLKKYATTDVLKDTESAGAWGTFAKTWTKSASLIGNEAALKALKQGEEHGINEYKEALDDDTVTNELKQVIKTQFIPKQEEHLKTINALM